MARIPPLDKSVGLNLSVPLSVKVAILKLDRIDFPTASAYALRLFVPDLRRRGLLAKAKVVRTKR